MRNAIATLLTIAMLATSVLIALDLAVLLRAPVHIASPDPDAFSGPDHGPLVQTFYDAANQLLAGEHSPLLATVVSPQVETHAGISFATRGENGVRDYLNGLRQRGALSLQVERLIGEGREIAVVIAANEPPSLSAGEARGQPTLRWRTVDLFRIDAGMIVGYWPGAAYETASPSLPSVTIPASAANMGVSLTRLELGLAAEPTSLFAPVPHLLLVETGTLKISREHAFEIARAGESQFTPLGADSGGDDLLLRPGDALLFPQALPQRVWNAGKSSASALSLLVAPSALLFRQIRAIPSDLVTVEGMHDGWRVGHRTAWDNDTITETLAVKLLPDDRRAIGVGLNGSQVTLDAGLHVPPLPPGKPRLAIVRSGVVSVSVINGEAVPNAVPIPASELAVASDHFFWAGDAFWIEASEAPVLANAGVSRLDVLLIDIALVGNDPSATPAASYATTPLET